MAHVAATPVVLDRQVAAAPLAEDGDWTQRAPHSGQLVTDAGTAVMLARLGFGTNQDLVPQSSPISPDLA